MHYISHANFVRSVERLAQSHTDSATVGQAIAGLSRFALRNVLNDKELVHLYTQNSTLRTIRRWTQSNQRIDVEAIRKELEVNERYFVPNYVLKVSNPRYHSDPHCTFLRSAFENFETPPEIAAQGPETVEAFQKFCDREWPNYRDRVDLFWVHVGSQFRLQNSPKPVSFSPSESPQSIADVSVDEIISSVHATSDKLVSYAREASLSTYLHAPPKRLYDLSRNPAVEPIKREAYKNILKMKKAIKMLVFNAYRIELDIKEGILSDELLEALGFLPCRACCRDPNRPH